MKYAVLLLLPMVLGAPRLQFKRSFLSDLGGTIFDLDVLRCDMQMMLDAIGGDPTEQACEVECHRILQEGHVLNYACPIVCIGFQALVQSFHLTPETADSGDPCASEFTSSESTEEPVVPTGTSEPEYIDTTEKYEKTETTKAYL